MTDTSYLIFSLQGARYAVDADAVLEIFSLPELAPAPLAPADVVGLIDLRGTIMPVVDLRLRFGLRHRRYLLSDSVIVLAREGRLLGIIVDEVHDVRRIGSYEMQPPPEYGEMAIPGGLFIAALASVGGIITAITSLDRLFRNTPAEIPPPPVRSDEGRPVVAMASGFEDAVEPGDLELFRERAGRLRERAASADPVGIVALAIILLGDEPFGIRLDAVREFSAPMEVAVVPCSPPHIVGLANLRGDILTLVDVGGILGITSGERSGTGNVVVVQGGGGLAGIVVDAIEGVIHVSPGEILRARRSGRGGESAYVFGSLLHRDRAITLLDIGAIISSGGLVVDEEVP